MPVRSIDLHPHSQRSQSTAHTSMQLERSRFNRVVVKRPWDGGVVKGEGVGRLHWTSGVLHSRGLRFEPCSEQYFVCINPPLCHALWWDSRQSFLVPRKKGKMHVGPGSCSCKCKRSQKSLTFVRFEEVSLAAFAKSADVPHY